MDTPFVHTLQSVAVSELGPEYAVIMFHDSDDVPEDIVVSLESIPELIRRLRDVYVGSSRL